MLGNAAANKSIQQEWGLLRARRSWGEERPREWAGVAREAREAGEEDHFGMIFGFVVEKTPILSLATHG